MEGTPFGRYRLLSLVGRGGMGEVWRAFDTDTNRTVAVKVLSAHLANDPEFEQRFRREGNAAAALNDPHVVPIHHFGEIDGRLYVDMRLVEGRDLQTLIADGPLHPERAVAIIEDVASALDSAHRIGLAHRDVKPSNILIGERDFAYLIDFGIARLANETRVTSTGAMVGTWAYLAPERITGEADHRADIYALTCVLHECLTGQQPFPGTSMEKQIGGHLALPPPRPSAVNGVVPTQFDDVIAKGMAKNPDDRYPSAVALSDAARSALPTHRESLPPAPARRPNEAPVRVAPTMKAPQPRNDVPERLFVPASASTQGANLGWPPSEHVPPTASQLDSKHPRWAIAAGFAVIAVVTALVFALNRFESDTPEPPHATTPLLRTPFPTTPQEATPVASPAEALRGQYHSVYIQPNGFRDERNFVVRTDCQPDGLRCVSVFNSPGFVLQYVFADGKWTRNDTYEGTCSTDGVPFHAAVTAEFVLPEPPQDPITQFTVHGHQTIVSAGHNCGSTNFEENWVRTGD
jgi:serine/threonine-protein kinase